MVYSSPFRRVELSAYKILPRAPGPVIRITPSLVLCSDASKLPDIYHRKVNKSGFYVTGSLGETESVFNIQEWRQHAAARKSIAGPVRKKPYPWLSCPRNSDCVGKLRTVDSRLLLAIPMADR